MLALRLRSLVLAAQSEGMDQFRNFLGGTAGRDMLQFWIDCEKFKDVMEDFDDLELMVTRNRLYRLPLTSTHIPCSLVAFTLFML